MALNRSDKSRILRRYFPGMTRNSEMSTEPSSGWSVGGIITHKEGVRRNVQRRDATSNLFVEDDELAFTEPSGIIRFAELA